MSATRTGPPWRPMLYHGLWLPPRKRLLPVVSVFCKACCCSCLLLEAGAAMLARGFQPSCPDLEESESVLLVTELSVFLQNPPFSKLKLY